MSSIDTTLDEIINKIIHYATKADKFNGLSSVQGRQAILDWHNKEVERIISKDYVFNEDAMPTKHEVATQFALNRLLSFQRNRARGEK